MPQLAGLRRSGREPQSGFRLRLGLADDPPQFGCDAIQHRALFLHPLGVIVDLAGDAGHDLLLLLARGVIETVGDRRIIKAEIAAVRMAVEILLSTEAGTNFTTNQITVRGESRLALAVKQPLALITGAFS
jgi:hypothetical protein